MTPNFWLDLIVAIISGICSAVCAGVSVYAAIRINLVRACLRAEEAHRRIDEHLDLNHNRRKQYGYEAQGN